MAGEDDGGWSPKDKYEAVVRQLEREECRIDTRLLWMLTFQGFLLAARAFATDRAGQVEPRFEDVLPKVGIAVAALGLCGTWAAYRQISYLIGEYDENTSYPRPFGDPTACALGQISAWGIPGVTIVAWVALWVMV